MTRAAILYDPDCGFCRVTLAVLLRWDTRGRLSPVALGTEEADALLRDMPQDQRMASWHLAPPQDPERSTGGPQPEAAAVYSGGAAFPPVFALLPGGRPLARLTARFPRASDRAYRWAADHRSLLGRPLPAAARRWADGVISGSAPDGR